jgi:hypothetical protein
MTLTLKISKRNNNQVIAHISISNNTNFQEEPTVLYLL